MKRLTSCLSPSAIVLASINYLRLTGEINKGDDGEDDSDRGLNNMVERNNIISQQQQLHQQRERRVGTGGKGGTMENDDYRPDVNTAVPGQVLLETEQRWRMWVSAAGMIVDITTQRCTAVQPITIVSPAVSAARHTETVNIYA